MLPESQGICGQSGEIGSEFFLQINIESMILHFIED